MDTAMDRRQWCKWESMWFPERRDGAGPDFLQETGATTKAGQKLPAAAELQGSAEPLPSLLRTGSVVITLIDVSSFYCIWPSSVVYPSAAYTIRESSFCSAFLDSHWSCRLQSPVPSPGYARQIWVCFLIFGNGFDPREEQLHRLIKTVAPKYHKWMNKILWPETNPTCGGNLGNFILFRVEII